MATLGTPGGTLSKREKREYVFSRNYGYERNSRIKMVRISIPADENIWEDLCMFYLKERGKIL